MESAGYRGESLGQELETSPGRGDIVVLDGTGNEVHVPVGQKKEFPVRVDDNGCISWRPLGPQPDSVLVTTRQRMLRQGTNYVEVNNELDGYISFSCYVQQAFPNVGNAAGSVGVLPRSLLAPARQGLDLSAIHGYLQEERPMRNVCLAGGAAVVLYSVIQVISISTIFENKMCYVVSCYLLLFGLVTCLTEVDVSGPFSVAKKTKEWVHHWAEGLEHLWGRGFFYLFQGSLMLGLSKSLGIGSLIGAYMCVLGALCLYKWGTTSGPRVTEDFIVLASDRRPPAW
jgi:hypothetical protein